MRHRSPRNSGFSGGPVLKEIICFYRSTEGYTLKRKNLLPKEQILSFERRLILKRILFPGKQTGNDKSCFPS